MGLKSDISCAQFGVKAYWRACVLMPMSHLPEDLGKWWEKKDTRVLCPINVSTRLAVLWVIKHREDWKLQNCYALGSFPPLKILWTFDYLKVFPSVICVELLLLHQWQCALTVTSVTGCSYCYISDRVLLLLYQWQGALTVASVTGCSYCYISDRVLLLLHQWQGALTVASVTGCSYCYISDRVLLLLHQWQVALTVTSVTVWCCCYISDF